MEKVDAVYGLLALLVFNLVVASSRLSSDELQITD